MSKPRERRPLVWALACTALVVVMIATAFAAVPLYNMFCRVTGYGGTTQQSAYAPDRVLDRQITVRFDASLARDMPWRFVPEQDAVTLKVGEVALAHYRAENLSGEPVTGTATYNITPQKAGVYFAKIECFCFTEQRLAPGEAMDMPVQFFVDPQIAKDPHMDDVTTITLSYTFFPVAEKAPRLSGSAGSATNQHKG